MADTPRAEGEHYRVEAMTTWLKDELSKIGEADDLHISPLREDGVRLGVYPLKVIDPDAKGQTPEALTRRQNSKLLSPASLIRQLGGNSSAYFGSETD
jgi:hypothetical protein